MSRIYTAASAYLGLREWPGAKHNPKILDMFEDVGHGWVRDDETSWCAAFVGSVLAEAGYLGTGSLAARSYREWGVEVPLASARRGDVVVFWRESPSSWKGHVGFYHSHDSHNVYVLGGNQGNAVSIAAYPVARLLSVRRALEDVGREPHRPSPEPVGYTPRQSFSLSNLLKSLFGGRNQ